MTEDANIDRYAKFDANDPKRTKCTRYSSAYRLAQTRIAAGRSIAPSMLMATTTKRALTMSVTIRTIVPATVAIAAGRTKAKPIPSNPVRVGAVMTVWYQIAKQMVRRTATPTAYASSNRHDGINNGSA
jgi:hypothetical protein